MDLLVFGLPSLPFLQVLLHTINKVFLVDIVTRKVDVVFYFDFLYLITFEVVIFLYQFLTCFICCFERTVFLGIGFLETTSVGGWCFGNQVLAKRFLQGEVCDED